MAKHNQMKKKNTSSRGEKTARLLKAKGASWNKKQTTNTDVVDFEHQFNWKQYQHFRIERIH